VPVVAVLDNLEEKYLLKMHSAIYNARINPMLGNIEWEENEVYSLVLRDRLYTLVQMRKNYILQFFDIKNSSDKWEGVDLNKIPTLFFGFVAPKGLRRIFARIVPAHEVTRSSAPMQTKFLAMDLNKSPDFSAKLVELTEVFDTIGAKELTGRLNVEDDLDIIYRYELDGSEGNADRVASRLIRYFETGVNWDDSKTVIFKDVPLPPPYYGKAK